MNWLDVCFTAVLPGEPKASKTEIRNRFAGLITRRTEQEKFSTCGFLVVLCAAPPNELMGRGYTSVENGEDGAYAKRA
jgi:hypothetical protein